MPRHRVAALVSAVTPSATSTTTRPRCKAPKAALPPPAPPPLSPSPAIADVCCARCRCHGVGPELLHAVTTLTRLLRSQEPTRDAATAFTTPLVDPPLLASATSATSATSTLTPDASNPSHPPPSRHSCDAQPHASASGGRAGRVEPIQGGACGFDAILAWKPLAPLVYGLPTPVGVCGRERNFCFSQTECLDMSTLLRLTAKYLTGVHVKNPILDPVNVQRYILNTVQHGLDWSPQACLLCLVCAIGAIVGSDKADVPMAPNQTTTASLTSEPELAFQIFEQASKRLGVALSQDNILGIQCACLAGYVSSLLQKTRSDKISNHAKHLVHVQYSADQSVAVFQHCEHYLVRCIFPLVSLPT